VSEPYIAVRRSLGSNANWLEIYALLRPRRKIDAGALAEGDELGSNILHSKEPIIEPVLVNRAYPAIAD
jgi:hypothetical protein